jgi:hypothetical protein
MGGLTYVMSGEVDAGYKLHHIRAAVAPAVALGFKDTTTGQALESVCEAPGPRRAWRA